MERDKPNGIAGRKFIISTHTLTWSVTVTPSYVAVTSAISTHTLTWSVTALALIGSILGYDFNSHAHVERDMLIYKQLQPKQISTHTLTWSVTCNFCWSYWC